MVKFIDIINQRLELYRLEKRYINSRNRRCTFVSDAVYVNGEYYSANTYPANGTAGDGECGSSSSSSKENKLIRDAMGKTVASTRAKRVNFMDWRGGSVRGKHGGRNGTKVSVRELNWDGSVRS